VSRPGIYRKLYDKAHYTVDAESRVMLECHLTTGAQHECTVLPERLTSLLDDGHWPIEEVLADKAYGRGPTYAFLRQRGMRAYIPLHLNRTTEHSYTQAASCEISSCAVSTARSAWTAAVTSRV
jgi:hypothetical protein